MKYSEADIERIVNRRINHVLSQLGLEYLQYSDVVVGRLHQDYVPIQNPDDRLKHLLDYLELEMITGTMVRPKGKKK